MLALTGLVVSYNGMIYALSRQSFSLGRAGYFPAFLGTVHKKFRTPSASLAVWTVVTIAFIVVSYKYEDATSVAVLISTLTAVLWYIGAMICLFVLRRKEREMVRPYRVPLYPILPFFIAVLSLFAAYLYGGAYRDKILWPTAALYVIALAWYFLWARRKVLPVAPEEVAARIAQELARREGGAAVVVSPPRSLGRMLLERTTGGALVLGLLSLVWMLLRRSEVLGPLRSEAFEVAGTVVLWSALFVLVSAIGLLSTRRKGA